VYPGEGGGQKWPKIAYIPNGVPLIQPMEFDLNLMISLYIAWPVSGLTSK